MTRNYGPSCSEEELILDARRGSCQAFDELVRRFRDEMIVVAHRATGSREVAEDIVQDAFLQAFHALPKLRDPAKFAGWLAVITRYRARRVRARDRHDEPTEAATLGQLLQSCWGERALSAAEQWQRKAERAEVRTALAKLPPEYRLVLQLYYYEEWSVGQIAAHLSLPITTVKWRLHRGRCLMRSQLARRLELRFLTEVPVDPPTGGAGDRGDRAVPAREVLRLFSRPGRRHARSVVLTWAHRWRGRELGRRGAEIQLLLHDLATEAEGCQHAEV